MHKYGLIGYPVSHSKSPELFCAAYAEHPGLTYDLIEEDNFDRAFARFMADYEAVNDTIARELFAVNILKKKDGKIYGYNSDFWAMQKLLEPYADRRTRPRVLVIGCGGAGKAAALAALKLRMSVAVANRDFRKVRDFCFKGGGLIPLRLDQAVSYAASTQILVYALPLRIDLADALPLEGRIIVESNYKDPCLKQACESVGATYISGMDWLGEQAIAGYRLMTGIEPDSARVMACCASQ